MCAKSSTFAPDFEKYCFMKKILVLFMAMLPLIGTYAAKTDRETVVLSCELHCQGCCDKVMKNIAFEKGVKDIICDLKTKTVTVTFDNRKTDVPTLLQAFKRIGKPAQVVKTGAPKTKNEK